MQTHFHSRRVRFVPSRARWLLIASLSASFGGCISKNTNIGTDALQKPAKGDKEEEADSGNGRPSNHDLEDSGLSVSGDDTSPSVLPKPGPSPTTDQESTSNETSHGGAPQDEPTSAQTTDADAGAGSTSGEPSNPAPSATSECKTDDDCEESNVACEAKACNDGVCAYSREDSLCADAEICTSAGCCADADHDGYPKAECAGARADDVAGDCDDDNESIHPDAAEGCDGIDLNCSGSNEPVLGEAVMLTDSSYAKQRFAVAHDGAGNFLIAWYAMRTGTPVIEAQTVSADGELGDVAQLNTDDYEVDDGSKKTHAVIAGYSPKKHKYAVAWTAKADTYQLPSVATLVTATGEPDGDNVLLEGWLPPGIPYDAATGALDLNRTTSSDFPYADGAFILPQRNLPNAYSPPTVVFSDSGTTTAVDTNNVWVDEYLSIGDRFVGYSIAAEPKLWFFTTGGQVASSVDVAGGYVHGAGSYNLVWDGDAIAFGTWDTSHVAYLERLTLDGQTWTTTKLSDLSFSPSNDLVYAENAGGSDGLIGMLGGDGSNNLYFVAPNRNGDPAVAAGVIGSFKNMERPRLFYTGERWVAFVVASPKSGPSQVYMTEIACE